MTASPAPACSADELSVHRLALQRRLAALGGELAAGRAKIDAATADAPAVTSHSDAAERAAQAGVDDAEFERDLTEAAAVRAALRRIAEGGYGWCSDCAEPIGNERLVVQPTASRCAPCQAAAERRGAG